MLTFAESLGFNLRKLDRIRPPDLVPHDRQDVGERRTRQPIRNFYSCSLESTMEKL